MKNKTEKNEYIVPAIEVIEMEHEGVLAGSNSLNDFDKGDTDPFGGTAANRIGGSTYHGSSFSDMEDMINDILTFEP